MARASYRRNAEKRKAYQREYIERNPEKVRERSRRYYEQNSIKIFAKVKKYREANPEQIARAKLKWQRDNPGKSRAIRKRYENANRSKIEARRAKRYKTDPQYRLHRLLRRRIQIVLKASGTRKLHRTMELTGCTVAFLKGYLEARFKRGMTWENYGEWHIDHRIPISTFNLLNADEQRRAFHYSNLQPLWAMENLLKGDTMPGTHQAELL